MLSNIFLYGRDKLTFESALKISNDQLECNIGDEEIKKINISREHIKNVIKSNQTVYGVNTGFGALCSTIISNKDSTLLQENLLKSHAVGVGENVPAEISKLMLIIKVHSLCMGFSGIRIGVIKRICWHIENNIIPIVPSQGSVGASGDLAPLAHLFLPLIGKGKLLYKGNQLDTEKVLKKEKKIPLSLKEKEGLALINGTQFISAYGCSALNKFKNCLDNADIISSLTLEGTQSSIKSFSDKIQILRPYKGSLIVTNKVRDLLLGSQVLESHNDSDKVQDPYSIRCIPQVHGASWDAYLHLKNVLDIELNSVTDNPIVINKSEIISGGNFHGQPIAIPIDYNIIAASEIGNISDRRIYLLLKGNKVVPKLLMKNTGVNSGFMILQYTSAALASENKNLCFPASADSITTSLGQEDHVSMGSIGAVKFLRVIKNLEKILAIELICSAQAFDYFKPLRTGLKLDKCYNYIRSKISHCEKDKIFTKDIDAAIKIIETKKLVELTL
jgi:histidine ammonia-lyase|tara:strand:+ start:1518 stop:3026 length:1509 start_codon:yes stop_codon:yes gene_type:complete